MRVCAATVNGSFSEAILTQGRYTLCAVAVGATSAAEAVARKALDISEKSKVF